MPHQFSHPARVLQIGGRITCRLFECLCGKSCRASQLDVNDMKETRNLIKDHWEDDARPDARRLEGLPKIGWRQLYCSQDKYGPCEPILIDAPSIEAGLEKCRSSSGVMSSERADLELCRKKVDIERLIVTEPSLTDQKGLSLDLA